MDELGIGGDSAGMVTGLDVAEEEALIVRTVWMTERYIWMKARHTPASCCTEERMKMRVPWNEKERRFAREVRASFCSCGDAIIAGIAGGKEGELVVDDGYPISAIAFLDLDTLIITNKSNRIELNVEDNRDIPIH